MIYTTWHEVTDLDKVADLAANMTANGWVGPELVADGDQLLTGTHRWAAAEQAGIEPLVIDIRELVPDWDERIAATSLPYEVAVAEVVRDLPADVRRDYGLDIH